MSGEPSNIHNRIICLDIAKAVGVILVIGLHTLGGIFLKISLSFTIPMFFIASAIVHKCPSNHKDYWAVTRKACRNLLLPPIVLYIFMASRGTILLKYIIPTLIFQRSEYIYWGEYSIRPIGIIWFFSSLFSAHVIFDFLQMSFTKRKLSITCVAFTLIGVLLGYYKIWLPLNFDIGLAMQFFMLTGYLIKSKFSDSPALYLYFSNNSKRATLNKKLLLTTIVITFIYIICFGGTSIMSKDYLNLPKGVYPLFPLCIITAVAGSLCLFLYSNLIKDFQPISSILSLIGRNSMYVYSIHALDQIYSPLWMISTSIIVQYILRTVIDVIFALIVSFTMHQLSRLLKRIKNHS